MKKPRILPVVLTIVLSAAVLFGGWSLYKQIAVASPLSDALNHVPGVIRSDKPDIGEKQVKVSVELSRDASLKEVYESMEEHGKQLAGGRKLEIAIQTVHDAKLEAVWQEAMFPIAEAMETKKYSEIPITMDRAAAGHNGVVAKAEMDNTNVYITLRNEKGAKYIVLPRKPELLGVWTNA